MKTFIYTYERKVFIAFRLLVCLGPARKPRKRAWPITSSLPFGFWSVWDGAFYEMSEPENSSLHCLSAFGLFGTCSTLAWPSSGGRGLHCLSAFGLFGTSGL